MDFLLGVLLAIYILGVVVAVLDGVVSYMATGDMIKALNTVLSESERQEGPFQELGEKYADERKRSARQIVRSPLWPLDAALALSNFARNVKEDSKVD